MRIGLVELIVIVIVAIALIKPEKLRGIASNIGKAMRIIKEENDKLNKEIIEPVKETVEPLTQPLQDAVKPVTDLTKEVENTVNEVKNNITSK